MSRLEQILKRCRRKGGDCPCGGRPCEAVDAVEQAIEDERGAIRLAESEIRRFESTLAWLNHEPCKVRSDWKMPDKPPGDYHATVCNEGEGWSPHWYSETEDNDCIEISGDAAWPFVEQTAYAEDWEKLGFEVV